MMRALKGVSSCRPGDQSQTIGYPGFSSTKSLRVFQLPLDKTLLHRRVTPTIKFTGIHLRLGEERRYESKSVLLKHIT